MDHLEGDFETQDTGGFSAPLMPQKSELYKQAITAWNDYRFDQAIDLFERSVEREPNNAKCLINLARAYALNYQYRLAAEAKMSATERFGDQASVHYMLGESEFEYRNLELASAHFRNSLSLGLDQLHQIRAEVYLARIAERFHQLDEAETFIDLALNKNPNHPMARLTQAQILDRQGRHESAIEIFHQLAGNERFTPHVRSIAWYAIGKSYESQSEFGDAFNAFQSAKRVWATYSKRVCSISAEMRNREYNLLASLRKSDFRKWQQDSLDLDPFGSNGIAWLIGYPRSGTTLTNQIVRGHADLISADEVQVFPGSTIPRLSRAVEAGTNRNLIGVLQRATPTHLNPLRKLFATQIEDVLKEPIGNRLLFNKNADLTVLMPAIYRLFPESKFMFTVRDPRDVIVSCFTKSLPINPISVNYFSIESTAASYAMSVNFWLKARDFLHQDWLEVRYEETVGDLESQARRMLDYLGLGWDENVLDFTHRSKTQQANSPTYIDVTKPIYQTSVGRWKNYEKHLRPVYDLLVPYIREFGYEL